MRAPASTVRATLAPSTLVGATAVSVLAGGHEVEVGSHRRGQTGRVAHGLAGAAGLVKPHHDGLVHAVALPVDDADPSSDPGHAVDDRSSTDA